MEADNQNSWDSLRSNLDRLNQIQGEPAFDTGAAWNKLSGRLEKKSIHRKPVFYWAAAAILLMIISAALYQFQQPGEVGLVNNPNKNSGLNSNLPSTSEVANLDAKPGKQFIHPIQKVTTPGAKRNPSAHLATKTEAIPE